MKSIKLYLIGLLVAAAFLPSAAQDVSINILAVPDSLHVGEKGYVQVDICNVDANPIAAPANKLRPQLSVAGNATIIGVADANGDTLTGWQILSLTNGPGNTIRLLNSQPLANAECLQFRVIIQGVVQSTTQIIGSTLGFQGPQTAGNNTANDNSETGIAVIGSLPVTLVRFDANRENQVTWLSWATTEETNSDYFEVQHSSNAKDWAVIGKVASGKESTTLRSYQFVHELPTAGVNYYRLRMVDNDLTYTYSRISEVNFGDAPSIILYPNPVSTRLYAKARQGKSAVSSVEIFSSAGRPVFKSSPVSVEGIDVRMLPAGVYILRTTAIDGTLYTQKVIIGR